MNNAAYRKHLSLLLGHFGTFTNAALFMDVLPRTFRDQRKHFNRKAAHRVALAAKLIRLREVLKVLRAEHGLSDANLKAAIKAADQRLLSQNRKEG